MKRSLSPSPFIPNAEPEITSPPFPSGTCAPVLFGVVVASPKSSISSTWHIFLPVTLTKAEAKCIQSLISRKKRKWRIRNPVFRLESEQVNVQAGGGQRKGGEMNTSGFCRVAPSAIEGSDGAAEGSLLKGDEGILFRLGERPGDCPGLFWGDMASRMVTDRPLPGQWVSAFRATRGIEAGQSPENSIGKKSTGGEERGPLLLIMADFPRLRVGSRSLAGDMALAVPCTQKWPLIHLPFISQISESGSLNEDYLLNFGSGTGRELKSAKSDSRPSPPCSTSFWTSIGPVTCVRPTSAIR